MKSSILPFFLNRMVINDEYIYIHIYIYIYNIYHLNILNIFEYLISPSLPEGTALQCLWAPPAVGGQWLCGSFRSGKHLMKPWWMLPYRRDHESMDPHGAMTWVSSLLTIKKGWCITVDHTELNMREITWSIGWPILRCTLTACFEASSGDWQQAVAFLDHVIHLQLSVLALACRVLEKTM